MILKYLDAIYFFKVKLKTIKLILYCFSHKNIKKDKFYLIFIKNFIFIFIIHKYRLYFFIKLKKKKFNLILFDIKNQFIFKKNRKS
jgi:hypothetical protein